MTTWTDAKRIEELRKIIRGGFSVQTTFILMLLVVEGGPAVTACKELMTDFPDVSFS